MDDLDTIDSLTLVRPVLQPRNGPPPVAVVLREVTDADLALLAQPDRNADVPVVTKLRDRHHSLARCLAAGMGVAEASAVTGYVPSRISILRRDPSFAGLIEAYRQTDVVAAADAAERANVLGLTAMAVALDRLEDSPDEISTADIKDIVTAMLDRTGHAPVNRTVALHGQLDVGSKLRSARMRAAAAKAEPVTIEQARAPKADEGAE